AAGIGNAGNDVTLTLNAKIQQAAQDALAGYTGACVVLDPNTGAVLAMASSPTYAAGDVEALLANPNDSSALVNRAMQTRYAPGSTFKMLTLATALQDNIATENTVYASPATMDIGNAPVINYDKTGYGDITLARATEVSSNTVFGQVGAQIGAKNLVDAAAQYGFNKEIGLELPLTESLMPDPKEMTEWETAWAAVGQPVGEHESSAGPYATVMQMAMISAAIANDGVIQTPYFVDALYSANGEKSYGASPKLFSQPLSASVANRTKTVLEGVVNAGTGTPAAIAGVQVAGKTGTAETGKAKDDSWFVGMAPSSNPSVVVSLIIEEGAGGDGVATPKAQKVLKTALEVQGLL
ncbi:MAG: penicillin-binding transpeptidase domain-containing protein, partial [Raoultibacter sp.]